MKRHYVLHCEHCGWELEVFGPNMMIAIDKMIDHHLDNGPNHTPMEWHTVVCL